MLTRLPDWQARLRAFVRATEHAPFAWSTQDCAAWPLRALDAMCGTDHAAALAGQYADWAGAQAYCQGRGWPTLADAARTYCGEPLAAVAQARIGDILAFPPRHDTREGEFHAPALGILAVYIGGLQVAVPMHQGLRLTPILVATRLPGVRAFPVGAR